MITQRQKIDFYFDFSSPYGYLAATQIDELAARHSRQVMWHPILLGAVFKITGRKALLEQPLVGDYAMRDIARSARLLSVPCRMPDRFPIISVPACRAYYWLKEQDKEQKSQLAIEFCKQVYYAYFAENRDISNKAILLDIAQTLGVDSKQLEVALASADLKQKLRNETSTAIERGVFGSPFMIYDGEPFWGLDHFDQLEKWIESDGW